jgi:trans-2,3-dihydro-3-hydroxyanthranilate isomerase
MHRFYIVDVFTEKKYAGNQLAVFCQAGGLSDHEMQEIAKEMNYSETTFILSNETQNGGYDVRIFTPAEEVPFAGHPTLGTAYIIQHDIIQQAVETITLNLKVGQIPVTLNYEAGQPELLWMRQIPPEFGQVLDSTSLAPVLNLPASAIDDRFPIQIVSTGLPFIIVPLRTLADVKQCNINREKYLALIEDLSAKAIFVFCPETYHQQNDLNSRMFADYYGVQEDPATGSANGCLAGYLVKYRYFGTDSIDIRVEQGYEIDRPSLLLLHATAQTDRIDVSVGGKVILVAKGELE